MTAPRQILPGTIYLVTRRCSERRLFLRPSKAANDIFRYVLAVAAERYGILVHAFCVLSNHFHLVVSDPQARLPDFHRYLDGLVARAMNCSLGRWESFWDPDSYSAVRLETADDVLDKMVYVLANPVAAGLVRRGRDWPGLWSDPSWIGGAPIEAERPKDFFRAEGPLPASARLELHPPPGFEADEGFIEALRAGLRAAEDRAAADLRREGHGALGASPRARAEAPRVPGVGRAPPDTEPARRVQEQVGADRGAASPHGVRARVSRGARVLAGGDARRLLPARDVGDASPPRRALRGGGLGSRRLVRMDPSKRRANGRVRLRGHELHDPDARLRSDDVVAVRPDHS